MVNYHDRIYLFLWFETKLATYYRAACLGNPHYDIKHESSRISSFDSLHRCKILTMCKNPGDFQIKITIEAIVIIICPIK